MTDNQAKKLITPRLRRMERIRQHANDELTAYADGLYDMLEEVQPRISHKFYNELCVKARAARERERLALYERVCADVRAANMV